MYGPLSTPLPRCLPPHALLSTTPCPAVYHPMPRCLPPMPRCLPPLCPAVSRGTNSTCESDGGDSGSGAAGLAFGSNITASNAGELAAQQPGAHNLLPANTSLLPTNTSFRACEVTSQLAMPRGRNRAPPWPGSSAAPQARLAQSRLEQAGSPQHAQSSQVSVTSEMSMCARPRCVWATRWSYSKPAPSGARALSRCGQVNQENYLVQLENGQHNVTSRLKDLRRKVRTSEQRATLSRATRPPRDQTRSGLETPTRRADGGATALDPPARASCVTIGERADGPFKFAYVAQSTYGTRDQSTLYEDFTRYFIASIQRTWVPA